MTKTVSEVSDAQGSSSGQKYDNGKSPIYRGILLQFPMAIDVAARASQHGADKYGWDNWSRVPDGVARYSDAMLRHLAREAQGEILDPDSGLLHIGHTLWNALARTELILRKSNG